MRALIIGSDPDIKAYRLAEMCKKAGFTVGVNWSFTVLPYAHPKYWVALDVQDFPYQPNSFYTDSSRCYIPGGSWGNTEELDKFVTATTAAVSVAKKHGATEAVLVGANCLGMSSIGPNGIIKTYDDTGNEINMFDHCIDGISDWFKHCGIPVYKTAQHSPLDLPYMPLYKLLES